MNQPRPSLSTQRTLQRVVAETNRVAAPSECDRERITEALRARLGTAVLPEGFLPAGAGVLAARSSGVRAAPRSGLGRSGWLGVVGGTGVVAGVLGFVLGYGMAQSEHDAPRDEAFAVAAPAAAAPTIEPAPTVEGSGGSVPAGAEGSGTPSRGDSSRDGMTSAQSVPGRARAQRGERAGVLERAARTGVLDRATHAVPPENVTPPARERRGLSFSEVLERLQRANLALQAGQASLALIQLSELDRRGGDVLREERETTRVLALCAIGDRPGARRAAAPLLSGAASSIYAPRLDASCVRERDEP